VRNGCALPSQHAIDYEFLLSDAREYSDLEVTQFLREELPLKWRETYVVSVARATNLVRFRYRMFEHICDLYSQLEATGEVPYDQTIKNRVVAMLGTSARAEEKRDASRSRGWVGPTEELLGTERDNGHFMAHCIGGGLDVNVFSQERCLNRGRSPQGKIYRQMETYCYEQQPGTFCFSRPIYADGSSVPLFTTACQ
jgi:hypothetical protein